MQINLIILILIILSFLALNIYFQHKQYGKLNSNIVKFQEKSYPLKDFIDEKKYNDGDILLFSSVPSSSFQLSILKTEFSHAGIIIDDKLYECTNGGPTEKIIYNTDKDVGINCIDLKKKLSTYTGLIWWCPRIIPLTTLQKKIVLRVYDEIEDKSYPSHPELFFSYFGFPCRPHCCGFIKKILDSLKGEVNSPRIIKDMKYVARIWEHEDYERPYWLCNSIL